MSEFKGTPAPWKIINDKDDSYFPSVVFSDHDETGFGINTRIVVNKSHDRKMDSIRANALLISKAPEMLEMLKSIIASEHLKGTIEESKVKQLIKSATEI